VWKVEGSGGRDDLLVDEELGSSTAIACVVVFGAELSPGSRLESESESEYDTRVDGVVIHGRLGVKVENQV